jgi:hypothetical protein
LKDKSARKQQDEQHQGSVNEENMPKRRQVRLSQQKLSLINPAAVAPEAKICQERIIR